jgi:hypothetical protein
MYVCLFNHICAPVEAWLNLNSVFNYRASSTGRNSTLSTRPTGKLVESPFHPLIPRVIHHCIATPRNGRWSLQHGRPRQRKRMQTRQNLPQLQMRKLTKSYNELALSLQLHSVYTRCSSGYANQTLLPECPKNINKYVPEIHPVNRHDLCLNRHKGECCA